MNPLVKDMLLAQNREDLELRNLEGLLERDCTCEGVEHGGVTCQKSVSALYLNCRYQQMVCAARVTYLESYIQLFGKHPCKYCRNLGKDCWTIRPI